VSDGSVFAFDDFDRDGRTEFVTASAGSLGRVFIFENTANALLKFGTGIDF